MDKINIGISSIGSGVGQSVINSLRLSNLAVKTFGFGTNSLAYGLYECDEYIQSLSFYDPNYIDDIIEKCINNRIQLYIPGHDDDAHILSKSTKKFEDAGVKILVAGEELLNICRDKELMSNSLNPIADIFVRSYNKESFLEAIESNELHYPVIAKPRDGFASRGIEIINSSKDVIKITDNHIVQELAIPNKRDPERDWYLKQLEKGINPQISEISIQLVADEKGNIIGKMISYNKLNNGVPIEIIPFEDSLIWEEIEKFHPKFKELGLKGPFNLQGRLTDNGLKLFELNARFTGITGLRAFMGFNEVEACVKKWLELDFSGYELKLNTDRFGIRQTADKAISFDRNEDVRIKCEEINGRSLKTRKNVLITGATGYLGRNLITELIETKNDNFLVHAYVRDKSIAQNILPINLILFDEKDLNNGNLSWGNIDILIHSGFARPHCSNSEIAESVRFSNQILTQAFQNHVANIINISSQSVYGQLSPIPWNENTQISTESIYSMAKFSVEQSMLSLQKLYPHINSTSIRLGAITGGFPGLNRIDLLSKLVEKVSLNQDISLVGGTQVIERLDIRDAIEGIIALAQNTTAKWKDCYNLGSGKQYSLLDVGEMVIVEGKKHNFTDSKINLEEKNIVMKFGLDVNRMKEDFDWQPKYNLKDTINTLFLFFNNQ